ncbi:MAG TPA: ammonium transporter [Pyrinomonadaceae bacterium]|jgi:Amt family ammonium transporter
MLKKLPAKLFSLFILIFSLPAVSLAEDLSERIAKLETSAAAAQASADNAWILLCSALVLLMTVPGLALFYGGLVRQKNVLSTMLKSLISIGIVTLLWAFVGYSLVFSEGNAFIGGLDFAFLRGVGAEPNADYSTTLPQQSFMIFQLMFAIITPALITGAFAERIRFIAKVAFTTLWTLLVYFPLAHMVWGKGGFLNAVLGGSVPALDFAGGTVVHISSGVSALVCALYLGKRIDYNNAPTAPHNTVFSLIGAGLLWFGWFGFNAGSALSANALATNAFVTTHFAAATAMLTWTIIEWLKHGKPTTLGAISGAVAGLVCITPAAGFVSPISAILIGLVAGAACYTMVCEVKKRFGYDDTLDVFGIHGIGGIFGAVLTGVFATSAINPIFKDASGNALPVGLIEGNAMQVVNQLAGIGIAVVMAIVGSILILKFVDLVIGLRVSESEETVGLDATQHGETAYVFEGDLIHLSGGGGAHAKNSGPGEILPANLALKTE